MLPAACVYLGAVTILLGAAAAIHPIAALGSRRLPGLVIALTGLAVLLLGFALPAPTVEVPEPRTHLDRLVPRYQFVERHASAVAAPPEVVDRAIRQVTAREIRLFRTLTWIRRFGRAGPPSIINAPADEPILAVATRTGFHVLADEPNREIAFGVAASVAPGAPRPLADSPAAFAAAAGPGLLKIAMNFRVEPDGRGGSRLTTETRVFAADDVARRRFATYWRVIYPGSALIRRSWLAAIRRRAEP